MLTEIIFLLDRSGSMAGLEHDTIGGFNALIEKQHNLDGETKVTAVLFDDQYEVLWNGIDAKTIKLTEKEYYVRGYTALLDAVGKTILEVDHRFSNEGKPDKVIFVITTDGMENASQEFKYPKIKEMIKQQEEKHQWEFIFIGANIDVVKEADNIGVSSDNAFTFEASSTGVESMYEMVHEEITNRRVYK
ncbi:vWA domain-containing protein [Lederbergia panacisoli]|uniref:vWA domain-containing protein n=1 Tax=Lederbergia panacisoli TaxID=1255251 RepID=UPI00214B360D|nr:vWA domain-containing protein [Lederbergia panacisoli]MCR2823513.1 VWA domain-containing protein [Lederbergia panacisoli]